MKTRTMFLASIILALFASFFIIRNMKSAEAPVIPDLVDINNTKFDAYELSDQVFIISYFQTWCGDCVKERPYLEKLQNHFGKDILKILLVSDEDVDLLQKYRIKFPSNLNYYHTSKSLKKDLNIKAFPTTYLYGKDGKVKLIKVEGIDWYNDAVIHQIEELLK
jgi:thiol-disulfide isomerase/thioredoxin